MAHVRDRWYTTSTDQHGNTVKHKSARHGHGKRWLAVWTSPDGQPASKAFHRKTDAERHGALMEADKTRGTYIDPAAGKIRLTAFAQPWLAAHTADPSTRQIYEIYWRCHIAPTLGQHPLNAIKPSHIRAWINHLATTLAPSTIDRVVALLDRILAAAIDDELIAKNPCRATSVVVPEAPHVEIEPWPAERVAAVTNTLPARYRILAILAAGCGLRQGEIFGLAIDDIDLTGHKLHIRQQVKQIGGRLIFALPKHDRHRDIPLPDSVAAELAAHLHDYPAQPVSLPWEETDGPTRTLRLVVTSREHKALNRNYINAYVWKPTLERHGIIDPHRPTAPSGRRDQSARRHGMHALRHYYASVLLDAGESIKAVAKYLGHADPGFTLRTYTHLMPASDQRTRTAIDTALASYHRPPTVQPAT